MIDAEECRRVFAEIDSDRFREFCEAVLHDQNFQREVEEIFAPMERITQEDWNLTVD